ncbi:MAG: hypothetical protein ACXVEF_22465 [Polyangiales bacterium]
MTTTPWFGTGEPARASSCEERTVAANHGVPLRATAQLGGAKIEDRAFRFAANAGLGLDLVRVDRACRAGSGLLPDAPHLRGTIGAWFDATVLVHAPTVLRPAVSFAFGRHDVGWLKLPEWEAFAVVGAAHADTWAPSFSLGVRLVFLQAELRADLVRPGSTFMTFIGVHFDPSAW